jgi:hypothetical protein
MVKIYYFGKMDGDVTLLRFRQFLTGILRMHCDDPCLHIDFEGISNAVYSNTLEAPILLTIKFFLRLVRRKNISDKI